MSDPDDDTTPHTILSAGPRFPSNRQAPTLVVILGDRMGQRLDLRDAPVTIGRSAECDLRIDHPSVSRRHCLVWRDGEFTKVRDLQSTNKTLLNAVPITEAELQDGDHITIGESIVKYVGQGSIEARYHHELYELATRDSLTQLYNRRQFRELLDKELARAASCGRPLSLAIVDIDHFKRINDLYGHVAGDGVLTQVAERLRGAAPPGMLVARIGGEEFGLALPERSLSDAAGFSEQLRGAIEAMPAAPGVGMPTTVSIGLAEWGPAMRTQSDLMRAADIELYRAKALGRNRVCWTGG